MPAQITGMLGRLQQTVRQFTLAQRTLALIGLAVVVLGALALSSWLTKPTLSPLFANLSAEDASAIVDHLQSAGVAYELTDGGSTILVPGDRLYAMRLEVAAAGLPRAADGGGYSLLDDMGMASSDFQQQVTYQRALEGELAKTISAISGVEAASVKLALPEESVFVSETPDPTASVFVRTTPGTTLDGGKVQSIVHLVSAGIEGMRPVDVAVIDADGRVLSAVGAGAAEGLADGRTGEYEARLAANVQSMLDKLVGVGNAVVSVTADLDFDQTVRRTQTTTTDPELPPVTASTEVEEYTGTSAPAAGVLGPDQLAVPGAEQGTGEYRRETETLNNPSSTVTEELTTAPGSVRRQSISVVVSEETGAGLNLAELETAVAAAAGVDEERGDVVSVTRMTFDTAQAETAQAALEVAEEQAAAEQQTELIRTGAIAGAIVLAALLALVTGIVRGRRSRREVLDIGALEVLEARRAAEAVEAATVVPALPAADVAAVEPGRREDIMALAAEQPAEVAEVLRGWLVGGNRR